MSRPDLDEIDAYVCDSRYDIAGQARLYMRDLSRYVRELETQRASEAKELATLRHWKQSQDANLARKRQDAINARNSRRRPR